MATHYYYKEVTDPNDSSIKTPVAIDTLFQTKLDLSTPVSKDKETGLIEKDIRDLSNLFELTSPYLPSSMSISSDPTYIYVKGEKVDKLVPFGVKSVSRTKKHVLTFRYQYTSWTPNTLTFEVPVEYRDRCMFYTVSGYSNCGRGWTDISKCGGFIPPNTIQVTANNVRVGQVNSGYTLQLRVWFFEVALEEGSPPVAPEGMVDLADFFASKDSNWFYNEDNWWIPYVYIQSATGLYGDGAVNAKNLPLGAFDWVVAGMEHDDAWWTAQVMATGRKQLKSSSVSVNKPNSRWWLMWFGLEIYGRGGW